VRRIMWFALGFGAACAFCAYLYIPKHLALPLLILSFLLCALFRNCTRAACTAILLMGMGTGCIWFSGFQSRVLEPVFVLDGMTRETQIRCSDYDQKTDYGVRTRGTIQVGERSYPVLVYLEETEGTGPGMVLSGPFRFQITAPGGQKESAYYQGEGIFLLAYQEGELTVSQENAALRDTPAMLRRWIAGILKGSLPEDAFAFAQALLLGDTSELEYEVLTDLTVSGIRHIVAVSGLHVSVLFGLLNLVTFKKRFLSALIACPVLALFAAMTGFAPSVSRACIMCSMMMLSALLNREYDGPTALSVSGLILLAVNPLVIVSAGYQLSFASVFGIFLFAPGIRNWIRSWLPVKKGHRIRNRLVSWFALSVSVTLGATAATLPLCAVYFGVISLAAVLTNLLVLWAVSLIFYGLMAVCLLGAPWPAGAGILGSILAVLIRFVLAAAKLIGRFPLSAVYTCSFYITAWLVFLYVLLAFFLGTRKRDSRAFLCSVTITLCAALMASWCEARRDDVRFTVLDVGQGQCLLFQSEGRSIMVDCGGTSDTEAADSAAELLLSQGISRLDALILTHYDRDHCAGAGNLLSRMDTQLLILPPVYSDLELDAQQIIYTYEDLVFTSGKTRINIYTSKITGESNENSICILFDTENCDILITGDRDEFGERLLLRHADIPDVDVLVAGHHGSRYSTGEDLLNAVRPEIVCISAGANNPFGHPAPELLQRLEDYGCRIYRTDLHGDIVIRR